MRQRERGSLAVLIAVMLAAPMTAQEPTPPTPPPQPAPPTPPAPAAMPAPPAWAPMQVTTQRRGWFGISLSCDCYVQRGAGRVAYLQAPEINSVESGSPAWQAGMRSGDTLVSVDGMAITRPEGFERFAQALPGQTLRVGLRREGQEREVTVVPGSNTGTTTTAEFYNSRLRTAQRSGFRAWQSLYRKPFGWLGFQVQFTAFGSDRRSSLREPPVVLTVDVDGPAHRAGLRRGDTLTLMDGVDLMAQGDRVFSNVEPGQRVVLTIRRGATPERRVTLIAVARPDATPQELSAFEEYRRMRDSSDALYREILSASVSRAQQEITDLQRTLRELELSRTPVDSSRRRIATIDSLLRALRNLERQRTSEGGFSYAFPTPSVTVSPNVTLNARVAVAGGRTRVFPLRYSGQLGNVSIEARSPAQIRIDEVGDSVLVVTTTSGVEVKLQLKNRR